MIKLYLITGIIFLSFFSSCTYNNEEDLYLCDTTNVTYDKDILPLFQNNCYSCHHDDFPPYGNLDLADFTDIQRVVNDGSLLRNINHEPADNGIITAMPKDASKLPDCSILKIENWIEQGIPQN